MFLKLYCIALPLFMACDLIWLGVIAKKFYEGQIGHLMTNHINWYSAVIFYFIFIAGLVYFAISPAILLDSWVRALVVGAFFGFVAYVTYDLTNLAILKDWGVTVAVVDILWGTFVCGLVSVLTFLISRFWL